MELRYRREALVGAMLVLGTLTFLILMMWLRGKSLGQSHLVRVRFDDIAGLKEGDPVRTSGVKTGSVKRITLEAPGQVMVTLDVKLVPKSDARARILSADFFGARYIDYSPGNAREQLADNAVLTGQRSDDITDIATAMGEQAKGVLDTATAVANLVSRELRVTLRQTQSLLGTLNRGAGASTTQLVGALEDLRQAIQRVDLLVQQNGPAAGEAVVSMRNAALHADTLTRTLTRASAQFDSILTKVNSGRGPAAALLNDSTVVRDLMTTNAALRELLTDFRANPGRYIRLRLF